MNKLLIAVIVIALAVGGFFYFSKYKAPAANQQTTTVPAAKNTVTISNFSFSPSKLTVKIGDTVTWLNQDSTGHSVTANDNKFDTGIIEPGKSGTITFSEAGTFDYHCKVHPSMLGSVVVE